MTCRLFQNQLSSYLDGELPGTRASRLEAHLRVCPHCAAELNALRGISEYIRAASQELHVSQDFDQRVLRAVGYYRVSTRQRRAHSYTRPLVVLAAILLALLSLVRHFFAQPLRVPLPVLRPAAPAVAPASPVAPLPANRDRR
jgi:anti-sigma factor RsiW